MGTTHTLTRRKFTRHLWISALDPRNRARKRKKFGHITDADEDICCSRGLRTRDILLGKIPLTGEEKTRQDEAGGCFGVAVVFWGVFGDLLGVYDAFNSLFFFHFDFLTSTILSFEILHRVSSETPQRVDEAIIYFYLLLANLREQPQEDAFHDLYD